MGCQVARSKNGRDVFFFLILDSIEWNGDGMERNGKIWNADGIDWNVAHETKR